MCWLRLPGDTGLGSGGGFISAGSGGAELPPAAFKMAPSAPSNPMTSPAAPCWTLRSWARNMVTAFCVTAAEASPSPLTCCWGVGGEGGFGMGGVRGTPPPPGGGWGGLETLGSGGGSGGLSDSNGVGGKALVSCCSVSGFIFEPMVWANWAEPTGPLLDWKRFRRTASCSCVSWEFGALGSTRKTICKILALIGNSFTFNSRQQMQRKSRNQSINKSEGLFLSQHT